MLLTLLGMEGLKIYDTFVFATAGDQNKMKLVLEKFDTHFEPQRSDIFNRFKFLSRKQRDGETVDAWLVDLRAMAKS